MFLLGEFFPDNLTTSVDEKNDIYLFQYKRMKTRTGFSGYIVYSHIITRFLFFNILLL